AEDAASVDEEDSVVAKPFDDALDPGRHLLAPSRFHAHEVVEERRLACSERLDELAVEGSNRRALFFEEPFELREGFVGGHSLSLRSRSGSRSFRCRWPAFRI